MFFYEVVRVCLGFDFVIWDFEFLWLFWYRCVELELELLMLCGCNLVLGIWLGYVIIGGGGFNFDGLRLNGKGLFVD